MAFEFLKFQWVLDGPQLIYSTSFCSRVNQEFAAKLLANPCDGIYRKLEFLGKISEWSWSVPVTWSPPSWRILTTISDLMPWSNAILVRWGLAKFVDLLQWHQASKTLKNVSNFVKPALHMSKTCYVSLTNIHSFAVRTKHFHWSSRQSLGNCHVWKKKCGKTFTVHSWKQMVVFLT